jgi:hypothetical protein
MPKSFRYHGIYKDASQVGIFGSFQQEHSDFCFCPKMINTLINARLFFSNLTLIKKILLFYFVKFL